MVVFRWIIGSAAVLVLLLTILGYVLGSAFDSYIWKNRAKMFRQFLWMLALLWFNIEVWGRVVWTMVTWNR